MEPDPPRYEPSDGLAERRRQRQDTRRSTAVALAYIVLVAVVLGAAFGCPSEDRTVVQTTSTSPGEAATTTTTAPPASGPLTYVATLTGDQEIPPVSTAASGTLTLTIADDGSSVDYVLEVTGLVGVTIGRLRQGKAGENGASIMILYDGPRSGSFTGTLLEGSFTADDLDGPLKGKTIEDLVTMIIAGNVYFNLGTDSHSGGEIRGQLE